MQYWNNYTGECVWDEPEGYKEVNYALLMAMAKGTKSELWAAILVQKTWRAKKARGDVRAERGAQNTVAGSVWAAVPDPASGLDYYYNSETGEVTWGKSIDPIERHVQCARSSQPEH